MPKHAHGTGNLKEFTSSTKEIMAVTMELFDRIINEALLVRRVTICANHITDEKTAPRETVQQLDLFTDYETLVREEEEREIALAKEKSMQKAMIKIKKKFGKKAILKGMNLQEGATTIERNGQVGGHKA